MLDTLLHRALFYVFGDYPLEALENAQGALQLAHALEKLRELQLYLHEVYVVGAISSLGDSQAHL